MTYAEQQGSTSFNWNKFLNKKKHTEDEIVHAYTLSRNWITCACGNQCSSIPRNSDGSPVDLKLSSLGLLFTNTIKEMMFSEFYKEEKVKAKKILEDIEERTAFLLSFKNTIKRG